MTTCACEPRNHHACHGWKIDPGWVATLPVAVAKPPPLTTSSGASTRPHTAAAITPTCNRVAEAGRRQEHRSEGHQCPRLVGDRQPDQHRRPCRAMADGQQHRGGAQHRAEQLLGMADLERGQRHRVGDGEEQEQPAREPAATGPAHVGDDPDTEHDAGQQAWQCDQSVHGQRPTAPEVGEQCKGSTQNERAAVRRDEVHEGIEMPGDQCRERGRRLDVVVVPGEPVQRQPTHHGDRHERDADGEAVLTQADSHSPDIGPGDRPLRRWRSGGAAIRRARRRSTPAAGPRPARRRPPAASVPGRRYRAYGRPFPHTTGRAPTSSRRRGRTPRSRCPGRAGTPLGRRIPGPGRAVLGRPRRARLPASAPRRAIISPHTGANLRRPTFARPGCPRAPSPPSPRRRWLHRRRQRHPGAGAPRPRPRPRRSSSSPPWPPGCG